MFISLLSFSKRRVVKSTPLGQGAMFSLEPANESCTTVLVTASVRSIGDGVILVTDLEGIEHHLELGIQLGGAALHVSLGFIVAASNTTEFPSEVRVLFVLGTDAGGEDAHSQEKSVQLRVERKCNRLCKFLKQFEVDIIYENFSLTSM